LDADEPTLIKCDTQSHTFQTAELLQIFIKKRFLILAIWCNPP